MFPRRCIQEPWRNIDVSTCVVWRPGSVRHASPSPMGKDVPGRTAPVSSPGISPSLQTERASGRADPAPWTSSHAATLSPMRTYVVYRRPDRLVLVAIGEHAVLPRAR